MKARILIGPYKGLIVAILRQTQTNPPAWLVALPGGHEGLFFENELDFIKQRIENG
jgi:hypothetical protein